MDSKNIENKLKEIKDPELGIDIVTLGLIRGILIDNASTDASGVGPIRTDTSKEFTSNGVEILMTFTSPTCPFADKLIKDVEDAVLSMGFENARVEVTFDPPWEPSEDLRKILGI